MVAEKQAHVLGWRYVPERRVYNCPFHLPLRLRFSSICLSRIPTGTMGAFAMYSAYEKLLSDVACCIPRGI